MRRVSISLVCAVLLMGVFHDAEARKSYFGVKGGLNHANIVGDDADELEPRDRFAGGVFYGMEFTDDFGMRIDGLYVQKGAEGEFVEPGEDHGHQSTISLDYIEFPVLFMVGFSTSEKFGANLLLGPTFGFNLSAELEDQDHGETVDLEVETFELGATFGGGVEYKVSTWSLIGDVRYALGGTSINDEFDGKNTGVVILVGVKFPLGE